MGTRAGEAVTDQARAGDLLAPSKLPASESRALLAHLLGIAREWLIAHPEQQVAPDVVASFLQLVERRRNGEPLAYLLGEKEFYGRNFAVSPAVLVPRPETELLVQRALEQTVRIDASVLELGTGSGCVAITLALARPQWRVIATDVSNEALAVARVNAWRWQTSNVALRQGEWFSAAPHDARFDLIVSNPPYIAEGDLHLVALRFEPRLALTAGDNGLSALRTIIDEAPSHLAPGGILLVEHGHAQGRAVRDLFIAPGWRNLQTAADLAQLDRVTSARFVAV